MTSRQPSLVPALDVPEELRAVISTTFTYTCPWGCTVRVVESAEQPHVCVGEQVIHVLAPDLSVVATKKVADGLRPLLRQQQGACWEDGIRAGRAGLCVGVDDDLADWERPSAPLFTGRIRRALRRLSRGRW